MSKQYDDIQLEYDKWRECLDAFIEKENMKQSLQPFIQNAKVLELACGSGFCTYDIIEWGASSVTAVDISEKMIEASRKSPGHQRHGAAVEFINADCSEAKNYAGGSYDLAKVPPDLLPGGSYDLVVAGWLLTYAPDRSTLQRMFHTIALNLKEGGRFVGTAIRPSDDPETAFRTGSLSFWAPDNYYIKMLDRVADGVSIQCHACTGSRKTSFDSFYLRRDVYESAARDAGLRGQLEWRSPHVPQQLAEDNESPQMTDLLNGKTSLHFNLLIVSK